MNSLYKIEQKYLQLVNELEENGGELTEEIAVELEVTQAELAEKLISFNNLINILTSHTEMANKEIERINDFIKVKQSIIDKFKASMLQALLLFGEVDKKGIKRLEFETLRLSTRKSSFLDIVNEGVIPDKYLKIDVSNLSTIQYKKIIELFPEIINSAKSKISKKEITDDIKKGEKVEGVILDERYHLTIK